MNQLYQRLIHELQGAWRFRRAALLLAWSVRLAGWLGVMLMPNMFEASARIFIDPRTTLSQVTQGITVDANVESQVSRVRQSLLGGPELEKVVEEVFPGTGELLPQERQLRLQSIRKRIDISGSTTQQNTNGGVYLVSFRDGDRQHAMQFVDRLIQAFIANTRGGKREGSVHAQQFLTDQIAEYESRLSAAEQRLATFKKSNVGLMPGAQGDYFSRLQTETESLDKARAALAVANRKREELQRQLQGGTPALVSTAQPQGGALPGQNNAMATGNDTASRLREAEARLDELLLRFTEKYPDVVSLKETIAALRARQQGEIAALRKGDPMAAVNAGLASNPVFQAMQMQLNQANVEIASFQAEVATKGAAVNDLRKLVNTAPEVEASLARLNRDYEVTKSQYQTLVERLERARLSEEADETGVVNIEIIDPPTSSFKPVAPNRELLLLAILFAGLGLGGGLAYAMSQIHPVYFNEQQLASETGLPILGMVSKLDLDSHRKLHKRRLVTCAASAIGLVVVGSLILHSRDHIVMAVDQLRH
jgi:polysaccharide chain length determinant protein (PEP-CTERM system associated)